MTASVMRMVSVLAAAFLIFLGTASFTSTGLHYAHRAATHISTAVTHQAPGLAAYIWTHQVGPVSSGLPYDTVRNLHIDFSANGARIPQTSILAHVGGFTVLDNLYLKDGRMYIVSDNKTGDIPGNLQSILHDLYKDEYGVESPTMVQLQTHGEARKLLGGFASRMAGVTMMFNNDDKSTLQHMPKFVEEAVFGSWKVYTSLLSNDKAKKKQEYLSMPKRLWLPKLDEQAWRDSGVLLNPYILRSAFPGIGMLYKEDWEEVAQFGNTLLLDRVVLYDRMAAKNTLENQQSGKVIENVAMLSGPKDWWEPIRKSVVAASIGGRARMAPPTIPVITYISRQHANKRRFRAQDHVLLSKGLEELANTGKVEVNVVEWQTMSRQNQIAIASRTTIMIGIHGSGLTHSLWMPPHPKSMIIEAFKVDGYTRDYGLVSAMLGHRHVSTWKERTFEFGDLPAQQVINEGFNGRDIELDPHTILRLIKEQLGLEHQA